MKHWKLFLDHLMPIRKGHHLTGKQGLEGCDAAFIGANGEYLVDFPGKSSEGYPVQYKMLILSSAEETELSCSRELKFHLLQGGELGKMQHLQ